MEDQNEPNFEQIMQIDLDWLIKDYGKTETTNVQWKKMLELENMCLQQKEQLTKVNIDMENHTHELQVHIQELKGKFETLSQSVG